MTAYGVVKALSCRRSLRGKDSLKGVCKRGGRRKEGKERKVDKGRIGRDKGVREGVCEVTS